ncbi:MAG: transcriptional regulator [Deltaproteobacteria bacterium HGW-Deltaproteobacteria-20]|nr:MAG: transcriptional regulator [Deltaproteobacteria bacterium HGW-Deltaproteobacteria-20]
MHAIHIVSGGTGASAEQVVRTVTAQFPSSEVAVTVHAGIRDADGTVVHTLVSAPLRNLLVRSAQRRGIVEIDLAGKLIERLSWVLDKPAAGQPGRYRQLRSEYFSRIEAIEYAVEHDDGRNSSGWPQADVLVLGTSRVGKTPLCMVLATQGWRAANLPLVPEIPPPADLHRVVPGKVVGLTIDPSRLIEHRTWRARVLGLPAPSPYVDLARIEDEVEEARLLFRRNGFAVVDATDMPVEELAHAVMKRVER